MTWNVRLRGWGFVVVALMPLVAITSCAAEPEATVEKSSLREDPSAIPESTVAPISPPAAEQTEPIFDRTQHSLDDPASIWVISNKLRPLQPTDWHPNDLVLPVNIENNNGQPLREPAARAIELMVQQAASDGVRLGIVSAFRTYDYQTMLYSNYVTRDGVAAADTYSARPGHSEHQTGLAVDVDDYTGCMLNACFGATAGGLWVSENAATYGFVIRYPEGSDAITGFTYEPWHLRYVGVDLAQEMRMTGTATLEEFFGLSAAPDYSVQ